MMQAFRNAAKPLMVVVAITFFAWLVLDLSGITGGTGLLTETSVGKVNGRSIDARTYQNIVQQAIDSRQRQSSASMGLEDYQQVRDEVWDPHWFGPTKTLDVHVAWLRKKIEEDPSNPEYITTIRGVGFRLDDGAVDG